MILVHDPISWRLRLGWPDFEPLPGHVYLTSAILEGIAPLIVGDDWTGQEPFVKPLRRLPIFTTFPLRAIDQQTAKETLERMPAADRPQGVVNPLDWRRVQTANASLATADEEPVGRFYKVLREVARALAHGELVAVYLTTTGANMGPPDAGFWTADRMWERLAKPLVDIGPFKGRLYLTADSLASFLRSRTPATPSLSNGRHTAAKQLLVPIFRASPAARSHTNGELKDRITSELGITLSDGAFNAIKAAAIEAAEADPAAWKTGGAPRGPRKPPQNRRT